MLKLSKPFLRSFFIIAIQLFIVLSSIYQCYYHIKTNMLYHTHTMLNQVSEQYIERFRAKLDGKYGILLSLAEYLGAKDKMVYEEIIDVLKAGVTTSDFTLLGVADTEGNTYTSDEHVKNIRFREYYDQALKGKKYISEPIVSIVNGQKSIVLAVPIYDKKKIIGVLHGSLKDEILNTMLLTTKSDGEVYAFITNGNGSILFDNHKEKDIYAGVNIFTLFEKKTMSQKDICELVRSDMAFGKSNFIQLKYKNSLQYGIYRPLGINDWYVFAAIPSLAITKDFYFVRNEIFWMTLKFFLVLASFLYFIVQKKHRQTKILRQENEKFEALVSNMNGGVKVTTYNLDIDKMKILFVSEGFADITGYTLADIQNVFSSRYIGIVHPQDRDELRKSFSQQLLLDDQFSVEYRICTKSNDVIWILDSGRVVQTADGEKHIQSVLTNITIYKEQQELLRSKEQRYKIVTEQSNSAILEYNLCENRFVYSENIEKFIGNKMNINCSMQDILNGDLIHPDDLSILEGEYSRILNGVRNVEFEIRMQNMDGNYTWYFIQLMTLYSSDGAPIGCTGRIEDINLLKKQTDQLKEKAERDALSGLYNKAMTERMIDDILKRDSTKTHALLVLDIDNFKGVNDTLGHLFGDAVITDVGTKLKKIFDKQDVLGRIGGDEFAILLYDVPNKQAVIKKAMALCQVFQKTYIGESADYKISCSIGIALFDKHGSSFKELYYKADIALYRSKKNGKARFALYSNKFMESFRNNGISQKNWNTPILDTKTLSVKERVFNLLYDAKDFVSSVNMVLAILGVEFNVSHVYIYQNKWNIGHTVNTYEWCDERIKPQMNILQMMEDDQKKEYYKLFDQMGVFRCADVSWLQNPIKDSFTKRNICSTLQVFIQDRGENRGIIGFDECRHTRNWTQNETDTLIYVAKMLGMFVLKRKAKNELICSNENMKEILNGIPTAIFVMNPYDCTILYRNRRALQVAPDVSLNDTCIHAFWGGESPPCNYCPVKKLRESEGPYFFETFNQKYNRQVRLSISRISWSCGNDMALICCQHICDCEKMN